MVYVFLFVHAFLLLSMYTYCCLRILRRGYSAEVYPCFFLGCRANARVILAKTGHGPHSSKNVVLFYVLFGLYCSMYCLCVNVYCHRVTTQLQLTNISYHIIDKHVCCWMFLDKVQLRRTCCQHLQDSVLKMVAFGSPEMLVSPYHNTQYQI